jgi:EF hand
MNRFLAGGLAATGLLGAGLWLWQGQAAPEAPIPAPPPPAEAADPLALPIAAAGAPRFGPKPPTPPQAAKTSREEMRFNRYDRNRDEIISRLEMMSSRTKDFKKIDTDGNNLLTFEEWAGGTAKRFGNADGNRNGELTRAEFAKTRPKQAVKPACKC